MTVGEIERLLIKNCHIYHEECLLTVDIKERERKERTYCPSKVVM